MPVAEPRSPWVQGLPWALEPLLLGKASGGLHLTPDHRGVGARVEGVGKAFTPPSEPENFRFLKKERPVARPCSSPVCEMNQGDTDCDIPPLQEAKKKKKSLCTANKNRLRPPPRQRLLPRLQPRVLQTVQPRAGAPRAFQGSQPRPPQPGL